MQSKSNGRVETRRSDAPMRAGVPSTLSPSGLAESTASVQLDRTYSSSSHCSAVRPCLLTEFVRSCAAIAADVRAAVAAVWRRGLAIEHTNSPPLGPCGRCGGRRYRQDGDEQRVQPSREEDSGRVARETDPGHVGIEVGEAAKHAGDRGYYSS